MVNAAAFMFYMSLSLLITFFVFVFGTIVGSFLNVVILRYNTGMGFFGKLFGPKERSMCFSCGKMLAWHELIPVFSFCLQKGKCRGCKSKISWQYPLVELATGLIFVAIAWQNFSPVFLNPLNIFLCVLYAVIWSLLIIITVYDLRHKIIPDGLVYAFAVLSLVATVVGAGASAGVDGGVVAAGVLSSTLLSHVLAAAAFFSFFGGLWLVSGGRWLGFGDAKLVVGVGLLLGLAKGFMALTLAFWIGAVVSIALLFMQWFVATVLPKVVRQSGLRGASATLTMKSEIPFAPFIILGTLISFFWTFDIFAAVGQLFTF